MLNIKSDILHFRVLLWWMDLEIQARYLFLFCYFFFFFFLLHLISYRGTVNRVSVRFAQRVFGPGQRSDPTLLHTQVYSLHTGCNVHPMQRALGSFWIRRASRVTSRARAAQPRAPLLIHASSHLILESLRIRRGVSPHDTAV